jgi:hypothetical protein
VPRDVLDVAITSHINLMVHTTDDAIVQGVALFDVKIVHNLQVKTVARIHLCVRNWEKGLASPRK